MTFATGNVPLNDPFHRRGFMIGGNKVNLYPKADKDKIVYGLGKYKFDFIENLNLTHQWKNHSAQAQEFLQKVQKIIAGIDFSSCESLGDQLTKINFYLWPLLFNETIRPQVSNLISVEYDDIVIEYLLKTSQEDPKSFIYQMLFDEAYLKKVISHFEGKTGAWDEKRKLGSHLFWGISNNNEHLRMKLAGNKFHSEDGSLKINWDLESIAQALREKKLLPGMLLKFSLILFYMGMKPFAGYGSANYLGTLQKDMIEFLKTDFPEESERIKSLQVNNLTSVPVLLKRGKEGNIENYFAFDIMFNGGLTQEYFKKINSVPLKFFMTPNLNTMYEYAFNLYGKGEKSLIVVDASDYEKLLGKVI